MIKKPFSMILAMCPNGGIGFNNQLPFYLKQDLQFFSQVTKGSTVIMGRKTWQSIGEKPLKNRQNVVISKQLKPSISEQKGITVFPSLDMAVQSIEQGPIFVMGGKSLYEAGAQNDMCQEIYLTRVGIQKNCDVAVDKNIFNNFEVKQTSRTMSENNINFDFQRYVNRNFKETASKQPSLIQSTHEEFQYLDMIRSIIEKGVKKEDRTGVGTLSTFGNMMKFQLSQSFPLLTTKKVFFRGVVEELLWFIRGNTNGNLLLDKNVKIWEGNGSREYLDSIGLNDRETNDLGPVYGFQWRHFGAEYKDMHTNYQGQGIDQLKEVINQLKNNRDSRRIILSAWNPSDLKKMALPPCHVMSQFYVADGALSCMMYQRSCDFGLGVPFNIASYALLTCILADICDLKKGELIHVLGDTHIYSNHIEQLKQQLNRVPYPFPILKINKKHDKIEDYSFQDFDLLGYQTHEKIQMKMAV